jgi:hypothetical protein
MMYVGRCGLKIVGLSLPQIIGGNWNSPIWDAIYLQDFGTHKEILVRYGDVLETISAERNIIIITIGKRGEQSNGPLAHASRIDHFRNRVKPFLFFS